MIVKIENENTSDEIPNQEHTFGKIVVDFQNQ
jgi:hypothetical protein